MCINKMIFMSLLTVGLTAKAQLSETSLSPSCISDMAEVIGVKTGGSVEFDQKSNDEGASCKTKVTYDGASLRIDFGIKNQKFKTIVISPDFKTNTEFFYESACKTQLNPPAGIYNNSVAYTKHFRGLNTKTDQLMGQESVSVQVAKDQNAKVSFHFGVIYNPFANDQDYFIEATCF